MNVTHNAPRSIRSHLHRILGGDQKLYLLSPKQAGRPGWHYATHYHGTFVVLGKPVANRDTGRAESVNRWGVSARELRNKRQAKKAA